MQIGTRPLHICAVGLYVRKAVSDACLLELRRNVTRFGVWRVGRCNSKVGVGYKLKPGLKGS